MTVAALVVLLAVALWQLHSLAWGDGLESSYSAKRSAPIRGSSVPAVINGTH